MMYLILLGRIMLGAYFIHAGYNHFAKLNMMAGYAKSKGVPMATAGVWLSGLMLMLGGLGILFGVYTTFSIFMLVLFLLVTSFYMHTYWKVTDQMARTSERISFMKNIALLAALLIMLAIPLPWALSLMK